MHPLEQAESEMVSAIGEIMDKYNLVLVRRITDGCEEYFFSRLHNELSLDMCDILEQLLPINYGKVSK